MEANWSRQTLQVLCQEDVYVHTTSFTGGSNSAPLLGDSATCRAVCVRRGRSSASVRLPPRTGSRNLALLGPARPLTESKSTFPMNLRHKHRANLFTHAVTKRNPIFAEWAQTICIAFPPSTQSWRVSQIRPCVEQQDKLMAS